MKRLAVSIIILLCIILSSFTVSGTLLKKTDELQAELSECMDYCKSGNTAAAQRSAQKIYDFVEKNDALFNIFFNHNDVSELFSLIPMLPVYAEDDINTLYIRCAQCAVYLQSARRAILPSRDMIL
ncbi:MAG: DUF4363 family protein [Clostridia bacterium]|nr:DUF4363 family protein [Clostridia bacterium]